MPADLLAPPAARRLSTARTMDPMPHRDGDGLAGYPSPEHLAERGLPPDGTAMTRDQYRSRTFPDAGCEWVAGRIRYKPMTSDLHGAILTYLILALGAYRDRSGLSMAIRSSNQGVDVPDAIREPDVAVLSDRDDPRRGSMEWAGADVVFEIVSPDDPDRDRVRKRAEYAAAEIGEYWIVDPRARSREIVVLTRGESVGEGSGAWIEATSAEGETATGALLPGFAVDVSACLNAA